MLELAPADDNGPMGMELRDERKVVTVLFADLVGSTILGERLDPEDLRLVVGDAVARIVAEVERLGGRVKDLAGDGVLAFFGAPVTSEDDPERAIRAGLRIAGELASYAEEVRRSFGPDGFGVRVGIGTGPVVLGELTAGARVEYAAFGDSVNTAARLQASARRGAVLVDAETRRLAGAAFLWSEPLELELKGKAGTVLAYEVRGLRPERSRGREAADLDTRLVGRDAELAAAVSLVDGLRAGVGGILFITGEPGIGKSRLLAELLVEAWPERTIVPSLAERWEIAPDGLRYLFHLHAGLRWSDGHPLTAQDVEFGIKRVLDPTGRAHRRRSTSFWRTDWTTTPAASATTTASE